RRAPRPRTRPRASIAARSWRLRAHEAGGPAPADVAAPVAIEVAELDGGPIGGRAPALRVGIVAGHHRLGDVEAPAVRDGAHDAGPAAAAQVGVAVAVDV